MTHRNGYSSHAAMSLAWERLHAPAGQPVAVEITWTAPPPAVTGERAQPLSVGLSIDRSGSMAGEKLDAARRAALGVLDALRDHERFAAAAYDAIVLDISPSVALTDDVRASIRDRIAALQPGGSTALFDGYARAAELVALGGHPDELDSWVIVLSDGMGNHGLTDPATMRTHAAALAERGIRTIAVGIGTDYEAAQLTALAEGGSGEFHHATRPGEIVEIVLGELRTLRDIAARDLCLEVRVEGAHRSLLLGGNVTQEGPTSSAHFDRVRTGRVARAVALVWPMGGKGPGAHVNATWRDQAQEPCSTRRTATAEHAPAGRDTALATRAARLWHAHILARALELNEAHQFVAAEAFVSQAREAFEGYVRGLPEMDELRATLSRVQHRVGRQWGSEGHREAYVMAFHLARGTRDLREDAPASFSMALSMDREEED